MENATVSNTEHKSDNAKKIEQYFSSFTVTPKLVKILSGCAVGSFFGLGIRSALRHTRGSGHEKLGSAKLFGGVGVALRALGTATVLTCSGFGLLVIAVSAVLDVNTPRQFGHKMRLFCGDRLRLEKKESIATLSEVFRLAEQPASASQQQPTALSHSDSAAAASSTHSHELSYPPEHHQNSNQ